MNQCINKSIIRGDRTLAVKQFLIILGALYLGHAITALTGIPIPASVIGLIILFLALLAGVVRLKDVQATADFILKYLALFFVVPAVGIMAYFDVLVSDAFKIFVPLILSILAGLFTAGKVTEFFIKRSGDDYHE